MKKTNKKLENTASEPVLKANTNVQEINPTSILKTWGLPIIGGILCLFLIVGFHSDAVNHPWDKGDRYCDSASRIQDPILKNQILEEGGEILRTQLRMHPYHARLWAMYGHYYLQKKNWDSCIAIEKKALELGSGTHINSIVDMSLNYMNYALSQKLIPIYKEKELALRVIEDAEVPDVINLKLLKYRGIVCINAGDYAKAQPFLKKFVQFDKKDFDGAYFLAMSELNLGNKSEALRNFELAKKIDPNNVNLNSLALQINQH